MPRIPRSPLPLSVLAGVLVLFTAGMTAGDPPPPAEGAPPAGPASAKPAEEPKLICEQVEQMGSHFKKKVCATAEAWEARRRKDADQMQRMGDQGVGCGGIANPC